MFVVLLPTIMWLASGMPALEHIGALRAAITGALILGGLALSVWTIIYMKRRGKGNPMDAFDHEIGPRTQHLMTDGPYRLNRNPMLTGTFIYLAGYIVWLWTWQALLVWIIFVTIMFVPQPLPPGEDSSSRSKSPFHQKPSNMVVMFH